MIIVKKAIKRFTAVEVCAAAQYLKMQLDDNMDRFAEFLLIDVLVEACSGGDASTVVRCSGFTMADITDDHTDANFIYAQQIGLINAPSLGATQNLATTATQAAARRQFYCSAQVLSQKYLGRAFGLKLEKSAGASYTAGAFNVTLLGVG